MSKFRTKKELDKHIQDTLAKIPSEQERALRCFSFARAYVAMKEFDSARLYLESYLQSNPPSQNVSAAHKLMGDILVELGQEEEAFEHYKKSYGIGKTRDVLNKICALLQNGFGINETPSSRTQWLNLQKATTSLEDYNPKSPFVIDNTTLKSSSSTITGTGLFSPNFFSPSAMGKQLHMRNSSKSATTISPSTNNINENIGENLTKLIASNKATVHHHSTLLQFYLTDKKFKQGAAHVHKFMIKFASSYEFLDKAMTIMEEAVAEHEDPSSLRSSTDHFKGAVLTEAELFSAYFFVLENLIALLLDSRLKDVIPEAPGDKRLFVATQWLHKFDQTLFTKGRKVKFSPMESWWPSFQKHCRSQLSFFMGILTLLRTEKDSKHEKLFQPCFVLASAYVVDQPISLIRLRDPKLQQRAFIESSYRVFVCQTILSNFTKPVTFTPDLKALIYDRCFPSHEGSLYPTLKITSEFFNLPTDQKTVVSTSTGRGSPCQSTKLSDEKFWLQVKVSQLLYPESLHHQVWLQTQVLEREFENSGNNAEFNTLLHTVSFEDIPLSTYTMDKADADSISQLDVDIFLTLSTFQAWKLKYQNSSLTSKKIPNLTTDLVNNSLAKWWSSAVKFTHGMDGGSDWATTECRLQVQRGLEMIRNLENTLPLSYLDALGNAFTNAATKLEKTGVAKQFLHLSVSPNDLYQIYFDAAEQYYKMFVSQYINKSTEASSSSAIPGSKTKKQFVRFMDIKEFPELTNPSLALEKARFVLGWRALERRDFETALSHFNETNFAESSMFSAEIYKILAEEESEVSSHTDSGEKSKALLQKSKELLYETVDRKSNKPVEYLLGKTIIDTSRAPLPHPKLEDEQELYVMIDEVEGKLKFLGMNTSLNRSTIMNGSASVFLKEDYDEFGKVSDRGDTSIRHPLEESISFVIKTPAQKARRSLVQELKQRQESTTVTTPTDQAKSPQFSSTPKKSDYEDISDEQEVETEEQRQQDQFVFDELLEKLLEQNNVILDTVSQMEDEIKDLNDRFTALKKSKKCFQRKDPTRSVSFGSSTVSG